MKSPAPEQTPTIKASTTGDANAGVFRGGGSILGHRMLAPMPTDRDVEVVTADGPMKLFEAVPEGRQEGTGAVIVLQEAFGVNEHIKDVARRFAAAGYHAAVPHLFHRSGDPVLAYDDYAAAPSYMQAMGDPGILADVDATVDHLARAGWEPARVAVVGFCMGGRAAFLVASSRALAAAVTFYGAAIVTGRSQWMPALLERSPELATPWLGMFGEDDQSIPLEDVKRLREITSESAPVACDVITYPSAGHGFFCDARDSYQREAAEDAWERTLTWLRRHMSSS